MNNFMPINSVSQEKQIPQKTTKLPKLTQQETETSTC